MTLRVSWDGQWKTGGGWVVVEERAVTRKDEVHVQTSQPSQGAEVALQGPRRRVGPQPDVRGDVQQQMVSGEEEPPVLVEQNEVEVRVPRRVHDT